MKKIIFTITTIASLFIVSCNSNFKSPKETFTAKETTELLKGNALLVDVRNPDEVAEQAYDVKNVINIPLDSLESKLNTIPKDKQIIFACQKGGRSQKAFELSKEKGFINTANMEGGMNAWSEAGLPTKTVIAKKKSCCTNASSKDCNPDGTCKAKVEPKEKKACCSTKKGCDETSKEKCK
jgi:rhodanese-related sulfurtransferase